MKAPFSAPISLLGCFDGGSADGYPSRMIFARPGPMAAPFLESERLRLRPFRLADLEVCAALWSDERVVRYIGGTPRSRNQIWEKIQRVVGGWTLLGYGYWVVEERYSARFLGEVGFQEGLRPLTPSCEGFPEAGWAFAPSAWGRGVATEALQAALRWFDAHIPDVPTVCFTAPDHRASIRVATKCGYEPDAVRARLNGEEVRLFKRKARR